MANTSIANVPYFFRGTYDQVQKVLAPGGMFENITKPGMIYLTDRHCFGWIDIDKSLTLIGDTSQSVTPETGTVGDPIILDELPPGVYSISGTYQTTATETPVSTSANKLFIVGEGGTISEMNGDTMSKQVVTSSGEVVTEEYVTDAEIIRSVATKADIDKLFA